MEAQVSVQEKVITNYKNNFIWGNKGVIIYFENGNTLTFYEVIGRRED